jgi:diguanylate cyclase (GGDEF)-like protein/putative nucleotidyltransferase with HDIG domain
MFGMGQPAELLEEIERLRRKVAELEAQRAREHQLDMLTGLLCPSAFRRRLADEVARARRYQRPIALAIVGIDDFASVEPSHGFKASDELIRDIADQLAASFRSHDILGRTGAAEFAALLPETQAVQARDGLVRLLAELESAGGGGISASISIGLTGWIAEMSAEKLLADARGAWEEAQRRGGGRIVLASDAEAAAERAEGLVSHHAIEALAVTLTERDRYTGEHSAAVIEMSAAVARNLGLRDAEVEWIRSAALLHDIGKVAIPDEILHKPAALTPQEWELMKQHPVVGERILRALPGMGVVARIVRHEHERWDGTGYPDGLAGEQIPLGSRIILAADTYHAITSDRPYRAARGHAEAVDELTRAAGTQFDPAVTAALIGYLYGRRQAGLISV